MRGPSRQGIKDASSPAVPGFAQEALPRATPMPRRKALLFWLLLAGPFLPIFPRAGQAEPPGPRAPRFVLAWGKQGAAAGELNIPIGIAVNARDEVFVSEFRNNRVQKFSTHGKPLGSFPVGEMAGGLAVDRAGNLYVALLMAGKVEVYSPEGKLLRTLGKPGKGPGDLDQPGGLAVAADGTVYVADQVNRRVVHFAPDGKVIRAWGEYGVKPGQFGGNVPKNQRVGGPQFVALDREGNVFTTEASVGRVQKFSPEGKFLLAWGGNHTGPGGFGGRPKNLPGPIGIAIDTKGRVWVSATNNKVQQFTAEGKYLRGFGGTGEGPGQFHTPHGLALDSRGRLYVVDTKNHRVQKFDVGE